MYIIRSILHSVNDLWMTCLPKRCLVFGSRSFCYISENQIAQFSKRSIGFYSIETRRRSFRTAGLLSPDIEHINYTCCYNSYGFINPLYNHTVWLFWSAMTFRQSRVWFVVFTQRNVNESNTLLAYRYKGHSSRYFQCI